MFDFENLTVYTKAKDLNKEILRFLKNDRRIDIFLKDQLKRASISVVINIAEGSGKRTKPDRRNFYVIARGSTYECVAILGIIRDEGVLNNESFSYFYKRFEEVSKMLLGLINSQGKYPIHHNY